MSDRAQIIYCGIFLAVMLLMFGFAGKHDEAIEQAELNQYCRMLKAYEQTNGDYGHPDFENKGELCNGNESIEFNDANDAEHERNSTQISKRSDY